MSDLRLELTGADKQAFENLTEEEKQKFLEGVANRRKLLMLKTAVVSMFLVECFDDLEEIGMLKHSLKRYGKLFNKELEKYLGKIFDHNEANSDSTEYVKIMIQRIHKAFDDGMPPVHMHEGITNTKVEWIDGVLHIMPNPESNDES